MHSFKRRTIALFSCIILAIFIAAGYPRLNNFSLRQRGYNQIVKTVSSFTGNAKEELSYIIKDLKYPELVAEYNPDKKVIAASVIKIPILAVAMKSVYEGRISLKQKIIVRKKDVDGGSGVIKTMKLPATLTVEELLDLMITRSDNTATNEIINLLGMDYLNKEFKKLGLRQTVLNRHMMDFVSRRKGRENYTSSQDIAMLLDQMYNGELVNSRASKKMLSLLKQQQVNDRIPVYLPETIEVAHKTGLERSVVHDAGIVFTPKGDYLICMLIENVKEYKTAKKYIADTALLVYKLYQ
jgi:beta-lactamase class A